MKHFLILLGIVVGLTTSLQAQTSNDSPNLATPLRGAAKARQDAAVARAVKNGQCVYYITSYTPTGSHIPQVVCRYKRRNYVDGAFTVGSSYNDESLGATGSLSVGGALRTLDPAISSSGVR